MHLLQARTLATLLYSSELLLGQQHGNHSKLLAWDGLFWTCSSLSTYFFRICEEMDFHVCYASACLLPVFIYCALFHNLAGCRSWRQLVVNKELPLPNPITILHPASKTWSQSLGSSTLKCIAKCQSPVELQECFLLKVKLRVKVRAI